MGRPRGSSNPMRPSRLLKSASSGSMSVMNLHLPPLTSSSITRSMEEDLESQARSSIGLFGFGSMDAVSWSRVNIADANGSSAMLSMSVGGNSSSSSSNGNNGGVNGSGNSNLVVMERVCPIGTNSFLWSTMHNGETINSTQPGKSEENRDSNVNHGNEPTDDSDSEFNGEHTHLFASKILQQYLVKGVAVIPATIDEVIELLVQSDGDDMETTMQHFVGVKTVASGLIYRRRKKRLHRRHLPPGVGAHARATLSGGKSLSSTALVYDSDSSSSSSDEEDCENRNRMNRPTIKARTSTRSKHMSRESIQATSYMDDCLALMAETGNRGNLSIKWVVGDKPGRMFGARANYCLLDYECIIVNDWDERDCGPMYVRTLQSCYLPQCQPWIDEFSTRATDLQPTGFMVRESKQRDGYVEIQFVGAILEKAQLPNLSRRARLRSLVSKIARIEEIVTSRRLTQSLLSNQQPLWVRNKDRSVCAACEAKFGRLSRRRHHCRLCGEICCSDCCPKMEFALPEVGITSVRVCVLCVRKRRQSSDSMASSASSSAAMLSTSSPTRGPMVATPPPPAAFGSLPPLAQLSSSSSSENLSSSHGSMSGSLTGGIADRKLMSVTSSMLQRFKSNNNNNY